MEERKVGRVCSKSGSVFLHCFYTTRFNHVYSELMEEPANVLTPQAFGKRAEKLFEGLPNVRMLVRDREWIERQNMNAFLAVTKGSEEPPVFLEFHYQGNPKQTDIQLGLVGKGVTFDSGGISIKPSAGMAMMKADMGGAAVVLSTLVIRSSCFPLFVN